MVIGITSRAVNGDVRMTVFGKRPKGLRMADYDPSWEPSESLLEWAEEMFREFPAGRMWKPEGTGLTYRKMGTEKSWMLVQMIDSEEARVNHEKMKAIMSKVGVHTVEEGFNMVPGSGLEDVWPEFVGELGDGHEIWAYKTNDAITGSLISVDPEDYWMLMGDELYMRFRAGAHIYSAMTRDEMAVSVDMDEVGSGLAANIGTMIGGERVPPWMYGTYCRIEEAPGHTSETAPGMEVV